MRYGRGVFSRAGLGALTIALLVSGVIVGPGTRAGAQGGGAIVGEVTVAGTPPAPKTITVNKDPQVCGSEKKLVTVAVGAEHGLADAVVSLPDVKSARGAAKSALDQKGCEFHPDVLIMAPGELDILNSDGVLHNIHSTSTANRPFNQAQPKFKRIITEEIAKPEIIKLQCDVHSWMHGWLFVTDHAAVLTGARGDFRLENVPAGRHKVEVWHPVLGTQTKEVDVKPGQEVKLRFELSAKS
jgi:carboxypeptidase family protein